MFGLNGKAKHAKARGWKKKVLSSLGAFALVAAASATAVVAAPLAASAHTPSVSSTCEALTVNLTNYAATVPGKDAVPPQTVADGYVKWVWNGSKQSTAPAFDANSPLWQKTSDKNPNHNDQLGVVFEKGNGANASWVYWQAVTKTIPGTPAVPTKTNHVTVTIDGVVVANTDFSTTYQKNFAFSDKYTAHTYRVQVTAWDNPVYNLDKSGTSTACEKPPATKDASASVTVGVAATCGTNSTENFAITNATWDTEADLSPGTHTRTATAFDGHLFADGTNKASVTYTIDAAIPSQSTDPKGQCYVPPTPAVCTTITDGPVATNLDEAGWTHEDTRSSGKYTYVAGGLELQTTDTATPSSSQNKVTLYRSVTPTLLSQFAEPSVTFADSGTGVKPGMQVGIDVDGNGTWDGYLVGEPDSYGAHNWWTNKSGFNVPSGMGYASFGSWADFVAANPNAKVISIGLSLGSGVVGDWTVTKFVAGCVNYTFNYQTPPPVHVPSNGQVTDTTTCGQTVLTFTNPIELGTNEVGEDAVFTYTDATGVTQEVTVPANEMVTKTVAFPEDSGDKTVSFGLKGAEQKTVTVLTDCQPNPVPVTPENVVFHDGCGITDDSLTAPGNRVEGTEGDNYDYKFVSDNGTYYVNDVTTNGVRSATVTFVPTPPGVVTEPGDSGTYQLKDGTAVWHYTFTNEPCQTPPPTCGPNPGQNDRCGGPTPTPTPTHTSAPAPAGDSTSLPPSKLASTGMNEPIGVIAIIGGLLGVLGLAFLGWNIWRRRKTAPDQQ